jgi:hypothetical protein
MGAVAPVARAEVELDAARAAGVGLDVLDERPADARSAERLGDHERDEPSDRLVALDQRQQAKAREADHATIGIGDEQRRRGLAGEAVEAALPLVGRRGIAELAEEPGDGVGVPGAAARMVTVVRRTAARLATIAT